MGSDNFNEKRNVEIYDGMRGSERKVMWVRVA